jgi:arylsulfatase A-like enzyme
MKRFVPLFSIVGLVAIGAGASAAEARKPNILVIVADDLGYGELGIQGYTKDIQTPNVDALAKAGTRFTSGYVSGPYCSPTRAGLMTGRYQQRFGHEFNPGPAEASSPTFGLSLNEKTIGDRLKAAGYATSWVGKSHLGYLPQYHPLKRGFDEYFGFLGGAHDYLDAAGDSHNPILRGTERVSNIDYTTDAFGREAVSFIERHAAEPWFVYLAFNAVHAPLESTEKYLSRFTWIQDQKRRTFVAMLAALDDAVGSVLATIREHGLEEDTLIFFISDNGGPTGQTTSNNGPLRGFKAQTWEGGIRVPWIVQWKGHLPAGKVDDRPVIQLDILPTALAAAGVEAKPEWKLDGVNLLPYIAGEKSEPPHQALYWRFGKQLAIREGNWKLVKAPAGGGVGPGPLTTPATVDGAQLYDLAKDIGEQTNLAEKEPAKVKELAAAWKAWNSELVAPKWVPGGAARPARAAPRAARMSAEPGNPASATSGPWKSGDALDRDASPQIARHGFVVSAEVDATAPEGVIVAQGGPANGFALFLHEGKLAFALRETKKLTTVTASAPLEAGLHRVEGQLASDGKITISVDGASVGEGRAPGLLKQQPGEGLTVGGDGRAAVGDYAAPNTLKGTVEKVTVHLFER